MKLIGFIKSAFIGLYSSIKRFPVTIGLSAITTIILIILSHIEGNANKITTDNLVKAAMITALGIPISLCINGLFERSKRKKTILKITAYFAETVILLLYYFLLLNKLGMVEVTRYIALNISLYLAFIFIPYFHVKEGFELYVIRLLSRFFVTILYSFVLFLGIVAILFTINKLLLIHISGKTYYDVFLLTAGIFAPSYFLAGIPNKNTELNLKEYPLLLRILLLYIVMPLLTAYTIILYIYFAKIIITLQWPLQLVMHLVLWYSVISIAVIFLVHILSVESKWVKSFTFWFIKFIIPLIIMMFVSLGIRVKSYGITENRYYVLVLGLWVFGVIIYMNLVKKRKSIVLLISLALVVFLSVFGPWSSYTVSKFSQNKRLEGILLKYNMLKDKTVIKPKTEIAAKDKTEISNILNYFSNVHSLKDVKYLPKSFKLSDMEAVFGFQYQNNNPGYNPSQYFSYYVNTSGPIDIMGYDYLFDLRDNKFGENKSSNIQIKYDNQNMTVTIFNNNKEIYKKSLSDYGSLLFKKFGSENKQIINPEDMTINDENANIKVRFIFININGHADVAADIPKIDYISFYMLAKMK